MLLAAHRMHHRRLEPLAERQQLVMRPGASGAAQDRHATVAIQQRRQPVNIRSRRDAHRLGRQQAGKLGRRRGRSRLQRDITGDDHDGHAALADRFADRDLERARHLIGAGHELAVVAAFLEERFRMRFLEIVGADLGGGNVRGDGEHRHTRAVAVEQAVDQVQIARAAASRADRELAGQMRLGSGREGRNLLVPDMEPLDLALPADGVGQAVQAVTDNTVNALDACRCERFRELVGNCFHRLASSEFTLVVNNSLEATTSRTRMVRGYFADTLKEIVAEAT